VEDPYGILTNVPFVWLALALPLAWRGRSGDDRRPLGWLAAGLGWMTASGAAVILLLDGSCSRYEVDFLPALILLAVLGWFGCERTLAYRPLVRWGVRVTALVLLAGSVAFNGLAAVEHYAEARCDTGVVLMAAGRLPEAIQADRDALRARPDYPDAHNNLGVALARSGQRAAAMEEYRAVLRFAPESFQARVNLGNALAQSGRLAEAVEQYQAALRIDPSNADTHYNLGQALGQLGRVSEGQAQLAEAARLEASP
jgi:tetratricopeptide (TPR) repeat protein